MTRNQCYLRKSQQTHQDILQIIKLNMIKKYIWKYRTLKLKPLLPTIPDAWAFQPCLLYNALAFTLFHLGFCQPSLEVSSHQWCRLCNGLCENKGTLSRFNLPAILIRTESRQSQRAGYFVWSQEYKLLMHWTSRAIVSL